MSAFSSKIGVLLAAAGSAVGLVITNLLCILSMTGTVGWLTVMGKNLFDIANDFVTDILMPLGAMGMALFTGWFVPKARYQGSRMMTLFYLFILRWIVPIALIIIFLDSMNIIQI